MHDPQLASKLATLELPYELMTYLEHVRFVLTLQAKNDNSR